jgi:hypothetical protein
MIPIGHLKIPFVLFVLSITGLCFTIGFDDWEGVKNGCNLFVLLIAPFWTAVPYVTLREKIKNRKILLFACFMSFFLISTLFIGWQSLIAHARFTPSRDLLTCSFMRQTWGHIEEYARDKRRPPAKLSDLQDGDAAPLRCLKDGWENDLLYSVDSEGVITLKSLGADGKPGGEDKNADIVMRGKLNDTFKIATITPEE